MINLVGISNQVGLKKLLASLGGISLNNIFHKIPEMINEIKLWFAAKGMFEVLDYETILEIKDRYGRKAKVTKNQKVKYLQDNIIAYQDQAWGDGEILKNYQSSKGKPVDKYRLGEMRHVLISLREVKHKGDIDEINISWDWENGFLVPTGFWGTKISHKTRMVSVKVIFPKSRPPKKAYIYFTSNRKTKELASESIKRLADGKWCIKWGIKKPKISENYVIKWEW
jgi:hypothetical protein